jgi:acetyl esterase/lipase
MTRRTVFSLLILTAAPLVCHAPSRGQEAPPLPPGVELTRDVVYATGGGRDLRMHLLRPRTAPEKPMPVLVWIHGGAWLSGSRDRGIRTLAPFAQRGYFGATIEYRLSQEARFPAQIEDCKAAVRSLRARAKEYHLDPGHIGVWGSSAGGHLVALLGTSGSVKELEGQGGNPEQSSRVQAVCDWFGPSDLNKIGIPPSSIRHDAPDSPEGRLIGGAIPENRDRAAKASPITYVSKDDPPFLIMHGDQDMTVPFNQSELLHQALKEAGVEVTFIPIPGAGHGGPGFNTPEMRGKIAAFFDGHLKH